MLAYYSAKAKHNFILSGCGQNKYSLSSKMLAFTNPDQATFLVKANEYPVTRLLWLLQYYQASHQ